MNVRADVRMRLILPAQAVQTILLVCVYAQFFLLSIGVVAITVRKKQLFFSLHSEIIGLS